MTNRELRWWEPRGITVGGFLSVATESFFTPPHEHGQRRIGDKSYAIVAEAYCNFSSRIGYHFTAVDAYCSDTLSRNYISFRFKGGAADDLRRAKRCQLIGEILRSLDFQIEQSGDLINARLRKYPRDALTNRLDQVGRLIVATRHLDMRMGPGAPVDWYVKAFFERNYLFDPDFRPAKAGGRITVESRHESDVGPGQSGTTFFIHLPFPPLPRAGQGRAETDGEGGGP